MIRPLWPFYLNILSETIHLISWSAHSGLPFFYKERLVGECWLGFRSDSSHVWVVLVSKVSPIITSRVFYISSKHILVNIYILCWTGMLHTFNVVKWKCWCQMNRSKGEKLFNSSSTNWIPSAKLLIKNIFQQPVGQAWKNIQSNASGIFLYFEFGLVWKFGQASHGKYSF